MNQDKSFEFSFVDLIQFAWKYRKHLIIVGLGSAILTAVFTAPFFIKPKYKSEVVFYPTTINSIGNAMFTDLNKREADPLAFGEEEEAENALQLLNSSALQERIVQNFNLMEHYQIKANSKSPRTDLAQKMGKNITFKRTRHLAVEISVLDEDPQKAADIANGIAAIYDSVKTEIQHQVALQALQIVEDQYKAKEAEVGEMRNRLKEIGDAGVMNYEEQSRAISEEIYKSAGNKTKMASLKVEQAKLAEFAGEFLYLSETLILELESLSILRKKYEKSKVDVERTLPQKFVLTSATPAEKKSYPIRSLLVVLVSGITTFLAFVVLLVMSQLKRSDK